MSRTSICGVSRTCNKLRVRIASFTTFMLTSSFQYSSNFQSHSVTIVCDTQPLQAGLVDDIPESPSLLQPAGLATFGRKILSTGYLEDQMNVCS